MRYQLEGVFALGEGIEITSDENEQATLTCSLSALIAEDDSISASGVGIEVVIDESTESFVMLDAEECEALAELLTTAAQRLRNGDWEREVITRMAEESAEN
jgi:hypothetical protein